MGEAAAVQLEEDPLDRAVDPGIRPIGCTLRAKLDDPLERGIDGQAETAHLDELPERAGEVEAVQRQHAAQLGLDPIDAGRAAMIGHGEDAHGIGAQHQVRVQLLLGRLGAAQRFLPASRRSIACHSPAKAWAPGVRGA